MSCPSGLNANSLGCGVNRCCDTSACTPNISGPCVCATYGDGSPSQPNGWNYSFIAQCAPNGVSTLDGTACETLLGVQYAYSCYCRLMEAGDSGNVGDRVAGNAIFDTNGNCVFFRGSGGGSGSGSGSGSGPATTAVNTPVGTTPAPLATHTSFGARNNPAYSGGLKGTLILCLLFSFLYY